MISTTASHRQGMRPPDRRRAVLAIDEGTTGTRAAWVSADGEVSGLEYRKLAVDYPAPGVVEQDAGQILAMTLDALTSTVARARESDVEIVALAVTQQRLTAVLWDAHSGAPLAPALVWQDTRHAAELMQLAGPWSSRLFDVLGRPAGFGSPYLWTSHQLRENAEVAAAYHRGDLRFGSIDSWLVWNLSRDRTWATSTTNASANGVYATSANEYFLDWVAELGFPRDLLPGIRQDRDDYGMSDADVCGISVPILGVIGDQQAGAIGLGSIRAGQVSCVHGTGSFIDLNSGTSRPDYAAEEAPGAIPLVAWRADGTNHYLAESIVPMTGAALDWVCDTLGWFESPAELSALAEDAGTSAGVMFLPALAGVMTPSIAPGAKAALSGVTAATTRGNIARAVIEGIAHSVVDGLDATAQAAGMRPSEALVGGGLALSDVYLQAQADLSGIPQLRHASAEVASLRGAAFLAASEGTLWADLEEAAATLGSPDVFHPAISAEERARRRQAWKRRLAFEIASAG